VGRKRQGGGSNTHTCTHIHAHTPAEVKRCREGLVQIVECVLKSLFQELQGAMETGAFVGALFLQSIIYIYVYMYVFIYVYKYVHIYMYVCICICVLKSVFEELQGVPGDKCVCGYIVFVQCICICICICIYL